MGAHPDSDTRAPGGHRGARSPLCPVLIGRDDLLELADRRLASAAAGSGELLFLAGEAGIGKTRLLAEVLRRAGDRGFLVARAAAFPRDREVAGGLVADLAADLVRHPATAADGVAIGARLRAATSGDAHRQRRLLVTEVAELLLRCGSQPIVLALEDLHWADDSTLEVLARLARQLGGRPILVLASYRSDELYRDAPLRAWRSHLLTQRWAEEIRLGRLGPVETVAMITAITGAAPTAAAVEQLFGRSDGIPLHIEEFLVAATRPDSSPAGPDSLADAVLARAARLSPTARAVAGAAAVIGRSADLDLLQRVSGRSAAELDSALQELTDRFFFAPLGGSPTTGQEPVTVDFRHALIRDTLYADLPPHRRVELHLSTAEAAAGARFPDAFVSDHYERGHRPGPAFHHAMTAAAAATAASAHREAVQLYRRAQRTTPSDTSAPARIDLLTRLGAELTAVDENAAAGHAFRQAFDLCRSIGDDIAAAALLPALANVRHLLGTNLDDRVALLQEGLELLGSAESTAAQQVRLEIQTSMAAAFMLDRRLEEAADSGGKATALAACISGPPAIAGHLDATMGSVLVFAGRLDQGWELLEGAISRSARAQLETEAARGYRMIGSCASVLVEYDRALRWLTDGIDYSTRAERFNDRHYMAAHLAHVHWATGQWTAAAEVADSALADGQGGVTTRITALHVQGYLALGRGSWAVAEQSLREAADLGGRMAELQRISPAWWGLAETALLQGDVGTALQWCEQGYRASAEVRDAAYLFPYLLTGTRAHLESGDPGGAVDWVRRVSEELEFRGIPGTLVAIDHARGLLLLHAGQTGRARAALTTAADGWHRRNRFWEGTQAILDLARCAARSRRPADAADLAGRAHAAAVGAGATVLAEQAAAMGGASIAQAGERVSPLSARELQVATLIADGSTNRQIAESLYISPKTVAAHVEHILTKLDMSRRTQIAAWAAARADRAD